MWGWVKRYFAAIFICALLLLLAAQISNADESEDPFDRAMKEARYAIQFDDPASIQEGLNRYAAVIAAFPNHERVYEAKLRIFGILKCDGTSTSVAQAARIIEELLDDADLNSSQGQDIALQFVDFHIFYVPDLAKAESVCKQLLAQGQKQERSLLELRARKCLGKIMVRNNKEMEALRGLIHTLEMAESWSKSGFWANLYKHSRPLYQEYLTELYNISGVAAGALERSDDVEAARLLRQKPRLLGHYEPLRIALRRFEHKYILGGRDPFPEFEQEFLKSVYAKLPEPTSAEPQDGIPTSPAPTAQTVGAAATSPTSAEETLPFGSQPHHPGRLDLRIAWRTALLVAVCLVIAGGLVAALVKRYQKGRVIKERGYER